MSLDLMGADSWSDQYVTLRVLHIDADKLRQKLGGTTGTLASFGVSVASLAPKMAIDAALPALLGLVKKDYGVELEATVTDADRPLYVPPKKGAKRGVSEFWPGLVVGGVLGGSALLIWKKLLAPMGHRLIGSGG